jgi:hypothetical protein
MIPPRRFSARTVVGGLLAASILGAGVALAVEHAGTPVATSVNIAPAATAATPTPKPHAADGVRGGLGAYGLGTGQILGVITKDTGQTPQQIMAGIAAGKTLREIAGTNAQKVHEDAVTAIKTALDTAVTKKVIDAGQEQTLLDAADKSVTVLLDAHLNNLGLGQPGSGFPFGGGHRAGAPEPSESPEPTATPTPKV